MSQRCLVICLCAASTHLKSARTRTGHAWMPPWCLHMSTQPHSFHLILKLLVLVQALCHLLNLKILQSWMVVFLSWQQMQMTCMMTWETSPTRLCGTVFFMLLRSLTSSLAFKSHLVQWFSACSVTVVLHPSCVSIRPHRGSASLLFSGTLLAICESDKVPFFDLFDVLGATLMELQSSFICSADNHLGCLWFNRTVLDTELEMNFMRTLNTRTLVRAELDLNS